jgi:hypothetical protein
MAPQVIELFSGRFEHKVIEKSVYIPLHALSTLSLKGSPEVLQT